MRRPITAAMSRFSCVRRNHPHCQSTCVPLWSKTGQSTTMNTMNTARIFHTHPMRSAGTRSVASITCSKMRMPRMNAQLRHTRQRASMTMEMRNLTRGSVRCNHPSPGTYRSASISVPPCRIHPWRFSTIRGSPIPDRATCTAAAPVARAIVALPAIYRSVHIARYDRLPIRARACNTDIRHACHG